MSCERMDPKDFHSPAANQYTLHCLAELTEGSKFKSYVRHIQYRERLYLTWFLGPFIIFAIFYYHVAMMSSQSGEFLWYPSTFAALNYDVMPMGMPWVTALLILYGIPCIITASFVGFFEEPRRWHDIVTLALLTLVNVASVTVGGEALHYPPFVTTMPAISGLSFSSDLKHSAFVFARDVLLRRALCLQGFLVAGYAVAVWRKRFWARAWHPPLPLLTVPVAVGVAGVAWWTVTQKAVPLFVTGDARLTPVAEGLVSAVKHLDFAGLASLCITVGKELGRQIWMDAAPMWQQHRLPTVLSRPSSCVALYLAAAAMALVHVVVLLVRPVVDFLVRLFCWILPTDPTLWGLSLLATLGGMAGLWRMDESAAYALHIAGLGALAFALLINGFKA